MENIIQAVLIAYTIFYIALLIYFAVGLQKLFLTYENDENYNEDESENDFSTFVSIVVALKNEEYNIEKLFSFLKKQNYPQNKVEFICVDDESCDNTIKKIEWQKSNCEFEVKVIKSKRIAGFSPKKLAISLGIENSSSELIILIDANVNGGKNWLVSTVNKMKNTNSDFMPGIVKMDTISHQSPFVNIQALDFAGLVACGLGAFGWKKPFLCNGANIALRKSAFIEIGGYKGYEKIISGDDVFLLEKMKLHNKKIKYNLCTNSIVYTKPKLTLKSFLLQRSRWASKSNIYNSFLLKIILVMIFFYFWFLPLAVFFIPFKHILTAFLIKMAADLLLVAPFLKKFDRGGNLIKTIISAECFQFFYIPISGVLALFKKMDWK